MLRYHVRRIKADPRSQEYCGSPRVLPCLTLLSWKGQTISSDEILELDYVLSGWPLSAARFIGIEFGFLYFGSAFGSDVPIIEMLPSIFA